MTMDAQRPGSVTPDQRKWRCLAIENGSAADVSVKEDVLKAHVKHPQCQIQYHRGRAIVKTEMWKLDSQLEVLTRGTEHLDMKSEWTINYLQDMLYELILKSKQNLDKQAVKNSQGNQVLRWKIETFKAKLSADVVHQQEPPHKSINMEMELHRKIALNKQQLEKQKRENQKLLFALKKIEGAKVSVQKAQQKRHLENSQVDVSHQRQFEELDNQCVIDNKALLSEVEQLRLKIRNEEALQQQALHRNMGLEWEVQNRNAPYQQQLKQLQLENHDLVIALKRTDEQIVAFQESLLKREEDWIERESNLEVKVEELETRVKKKRQEKKRKKRKGDWLFRIFTRW